MTTPPSSLPRRRVVLITGLSGAGLSTSLKALEDAGYEAVDNLRLSLVPHLVNENAGQDRRPLAIAIDTRNAAFSAGAVLHIRESLAQRDDLEVFLLYLECSNESLQHRFTATRRRHPLAVDRPLTDGIKTEREMLEAIRDEADLTIDTSDLTIHDLRRLVVEHYRFDKTPGLTLFVMSFSYGRGIPREADLVLDARFLRNPHYVQKLRPLSGQNTEVARYIQNDPDYEPFLENTTNLLVPLLPRFQKEGKSYLTIAVGCTGGRHRSVLVAEQLATNIAGHGYIVGIGHRDILKTQTPKG